MFKVGDKVTVVRKVGDDEEWDDSWVSGMNEYVGSGRELIVTSVLDKKIRARIDGDSWWWPTSCLRGEPGLFD